MKSAQFERKPLEDPILHYAARMEVFFMKTALLQKSLSVKQDHKGNGKVQLISATSLQGDTGGHTELYLNFEL